MDVLVGGAFGAAVGAVEVERLRLADGAAPVVRQPAHAFLAQRPALQAAVDLVRRGEQKRSLRRRRPHRLEDVEGAARVDLEVGLRVAHRGRDRDLRGKVEHGVLPADCLANRRPVAYVSMDETQRRPMDALDPGQVLLGPLAGEVVEERDRPAFLEEMIGGVDPDEPSAARDQHGSRGHRGSILPQGLARLRRSSPREANT